MRCHILGGVLGGNEAENRGPTSRHPHGSRAGASQIGQSPRDGLEPLAIEGQTMIAGESVIADTASSEPRREGRIS